RLGCRTEEAEGALGAVHEWWEEEASSAGRAAWAHWTAGRADACPAGGQADVRPCAYGTAPASAGPAADPRRATARRRAPRGRQAREPRARRTAQRELRQVRLRQRRSD